MNLFKRTIKLKMNFTFDDRSIVIILINGKIYLKSELKNSFVVIVNSENDDFVIQRRICMRRMK